jgi:hypothetical protein
MGGLAGSAGGSELHVLVVECAQALRSFLLNSGGVGVDMFCMQRTMPLVALCLWETNRPGGFVKVHLAAVAAISHS